MINENHSISKSRPLLAMRNSGYNLGEFKILDIYLSRINPLDPGTASVNITKAEYCAAMGIESGKVRVEQLKKYTKHFIGNVVEIPRQDGKRGYEQNVLFTKALYDEDEEVITLVCNPDPVVFDTFFNVKNVGYVRYILKNTLNLKSAYAYKLYMLVKSKSPATEFRIDLSELREKLEVTAKRYESFKYFNQEILKNIVEEINKNTDTYVEYEKITKGRLTKAIRFIIKSQPIIESDQLEGQMDIYDFPEYCPPEPLELTREQIYAKKINDEAFRGEFTLEQAEYLVKLGSKVAQTRVNPDMLFDQEACDIAKISYYEEKYLQMRAGANSKSSKARTNYLAALLKADFADSLGFVPDKVEKGKYVPKKGNKFNNFEGRNYDFDELEKLLVNSQ